ncbi:MAG: alpha/beta hydrolase [bacterium]|jgi:acetyl esterase/lipase|nr:alpha/beta hydrolase [bacterium]
MKQLKPIFLSCGIFLLSVILLSGAIAQEAAETPQDATVTVEAATAEAVQETAAPVVETVQGKEELLYPNGAPGALGEEEKDKPTLIYYLPSPEKANGAAIVVCPGGGYGGLAMDHEGYQVCEWLNSVGVAGIILKYRLPAKGYPHPVPLQDAQQAIRTVRAKAADLRIDPNRIGIMGFSAGGHLASTAGTHFDYGQPSSPDPILQASSRPDFMVLVYPVVTMKGYTHKGSRNNLLGANPSADLLTLLSNEEQVTPTTPQTFLIHTFEDTAVPVENSLQLCQALRANGVPVEMHLFQRGPHGFGMRKDDPILAQWPTLCTDWMRVRGIIPE